MHWGPQCVGCRVPLKGSIGGPLKRSIGFRV